MKMTFAIYRETTETELGTRTREVLPFEIEIPAGPLIALAL